jgi:adenylate kinase
VIVRVVLLGPPGVGKGTQGRRLAAGHGWALISTGEMLREAVAKRTPLGIEAQRLMDAGQLVGDDVMIELVKERSGMPDAAAGFVMDGYPRTVPQAEALETLLKERAQTLDAAVSLAADEGELARRLSSRRECPICKRAYNLVSWPPLDGRHCDDHPAAELIRRADDAPETVVRRLEVYGRSTAPLLEHYRSRSTLREVPGLGTVDEVYGSLLRSLGI